MLKVYNDDDNNDIDRQRTNLDQKSSLEPSAKVGQNSLVKKAIQTVFRKKNPYPRFQSFRDNFIENVPFVTYTKNQYYLRDKELL